MALPTIGVSIDFANGPSFGYPFILGDNANGILDTNILADTAPDIVDVTAQVQKVSTRRGRNRILSNFEAGTATVVLNDPDSDFNPFNTSSPYYGKLQPLRKIRIWADLYLAPDTLRFYIFSGYITSYDTNFAQGVTDTSTVTLQCVDGFRLLNNVSTGTPPVPGCTAGQLSGTRINELLDFAGFPSSMRDIDPGDSTMQADPGTNRSVLAAIQTVEQSEFGAFYMSKTGQAKFLDRTDVSLLADVVPRTYSDTGAPNTLTYTNLDFAYDDQLILNDVTVTKYGPGAVPQIVEDADSILKYFYKSGTRTDILVQTDEEALDQAQTLVAARKDANLRIDSMTLNMKLDETAQIIAGLNSDIYQLVTIEKTMPGGSTVNRELFIQGVQHDVTPNSWTLKLLTAEPIIQAFILDSDLQGVLALTDPPNNNALSY